ncbi:5-methylthioadenosine/S-adenosylhomocysteine deaminase [Butyrivibrio fibrisolvens DSM 3071]|uniref:5-methylthioadenosine/S-adenosylhomocysteine deaminase n=1 Tax=Butyrivibrio fibrisolvens DSM 3071 TaxID=1121131 RepID=A0A1M5WKA8_BUTFI|nr:amidohydrolase [Butyrivibrio fibrisolvens]SHH87911.1 5-methylthioadenosine/S-adenosylhomocysteine deaminase [Butyrivibrio fibrisolvens DSM 3071]
MNIRFYNARILTMEEDRPVFVGEVWTQEDKISFVGTSEEAVGADAEGGFDREIDCKGNLLMPGFKDAHTHSAMTLMRSLADDLPTQEWLNNQIFPVEAKMTGEDIYTLTKLAILEYLTSGITAIFDMYLTPETIAKACKEAGMRCVQVGCVNNFSQSLELVERMYNELNTEDDPLNSYFMGIHAEYTCSPELLTKFSELVHKYKAPVFTHIAETKSETDGCIERYGMSPVKYLASMGLFDFGGGGYHLVHVNEEDMQILKEKNMYVVTNPGSNLKLASGIAPISDYMKHGIPVALGTDGPASNNCLDFFREMFLVTGLGKIREDDASAIDAMEVLKMATVNGAHAMNLPNCDILASGKQADLIMIDLDQPNMQPINNICKNLVYSGSKQNVKLTMIAGVIRYEDGKFNIGVDPHDLYAEAENIKKRIMSELGRD